MNRRPEEREHWRDRPGDLAPEGTPGTGEALCPHCSGSGRLQGAPCANCDGTGIVIAGIGGA
jgi:hypothetical protein